MMLRIVVDFGLLWLSPTDITAVLGIEEQKAGATHSGNDAPYLRSPRRLADAAADPLQTFQEVMDGIRIYFDRALGTILLYRYERPQVPALRRIYWPLTHPCVLLNMISTTK